MTTRHLVSLLGSLALTVIGLRVEAATISLQPSVPLVAQSSAFTVDLLLDASDAPGAHPGLYGGQIVIDFDPALLTYGGFSLAGDVRFFSSPVTGTRGGRQTVTLGFENAGDVGTVGNFSFTVLGAPGIIASINLADADDLFGTFVSYVRSDQPFYPDFVDTSVQVVPLPGTAWLLLTAFAAAGTRARRLLRAPLAAR